MNKIKTVCIFGAASDKINNLYKEKTKELGEALAKSGYSLIFGAGSTGLMGAIATGFVRGRGHVVGVTPDFMENIEPIYEKCDKIIITKNMEERKQIMKNNADAFIICPGGVGTMDEFFEVLTDKQLDLHNKTIVLYNIDNFFDGLINMISYYVEKGFIKKSIFKKFSVVNSIIGVKIAFQKQ